MSETAAGMTCPECGAPLAPGEMCRDRFYELLALEGAIDGAPGSILHFYAVATYNLQHPDTSSFTQAVLEQSALALADALDGRARLADLLRAARRATNGPTRVLRRPGDPAPAWPRGGWSETVADVLAARPATYDAYEQAVTRWARAVRAELERRLPG